MVDSFGSPWSGQTPGRAGTTQGGDTSSPIDPKILRTLTTERPPADGSPEPQPALPTIPTVKGGGSITPIPSGPVGNSITGVPGA